jgi:hypothetical protein
VGRKLEEEPSSSPNFDEVREIIDEAREGFDEAGEEQDRWLR